jgi:hypothetical protein
MLVYCTVLYCIITPRTLSNILASLTYQLLLEARPSMLIPRLIEPRGYISAIMGYCKALGADRRQRPDSVVMRQGGRVFVSAWLQTMYMS